MGGKRCWARNANFPLPFYSTLAGFAEPGETLEGTIAREIREEVSIEVENARYVGSQPWPFPHSLMIGFTATWKSGEIRADGTEIVDAKWFDADALPSVPPHGSIARRLIDAWIAEVQVQMTVTLTPPTSSLARPARGLAVMRSIRAAQRRYACSGSSVRRACIASSVSEIAATIGGIKLNCVGTVVCGGEVAHVPIRGFFAPCPARRCFPAWRTTASKP